MMDKVKAIMEAWENLKYYIEKQTDINVAVFNKLLTEQLRDSVYNSDPSKWTEGEHRYFIRLHALKWGVADMIAEPAPQDEREWMLQLDPSLSHWGWLMKKHPDGQWVSVKKVIEEPAPQESGYGDEWKNPPPNIPDVEWSGGIGSQQLGECDHDPQSIGRYATGAGIHCAKCDDLLEPAPPEDKPTLYCRHCRVSTLPSGWCGECFGYNGVTKDKLPETDKETAKLSVQEFYKYYYRDQDKSPFLYDPPTMSEYNIWLDKDGE